MVLSTRRATTTWGYDDAGDRVVFLCFERSEESERVARHNPRATDYYTGRFMYGLSKDQGWRRDLGNSKHGSAFR